MRYEILRTLVKRAFLTCVFICICSNVYAISVTEVSGNITPDGTLTITGTDFLTKSPAAPWIYDNFEGGTLTQDLGTPVIGQGDWGFFNLGADTVNVTYSDDQNPTNSTKVAKFSWEDTQDANGGQTVCGLNTPSDINSDEVFIFYKRYFVPSTEPISSSNIKQYYIFGDSGLDPQSILAIPSGSSGWTISHNGTGFGSGSSINNNFSTATFSTTNNTWQTWQTYYELNDDFIDPYNGIVTAIWDGVSEVNVSDYGARTADLSSNNFKWIRFGNMYQMNDANDDGFGFAYFDEIYADKTRSRVMIGDSDTFSNVTNWEIELPTAWSDTEITITQNHGSFTAGVDNMFLFVVDSNGVASAGFALTQSGGVDTTPPNISNKSPADGQTNVVTTTDLSFIFNDVDSGVDSATIELTVSGVEVSGDATIGGDATATTVTLANADFPVTLMVGETITWSASAADQAGSPNQSTEEVSTFRLEDNRIIVGSEGITIGSESIIF